MSFRKHNTATKIEILVKLFSQPLNLNYCREKWVNTVGVDNRYVGHLGNWDFKVEDNIFIFILIVRVINQ